MPNHDGRSRRGLDIVRRRDQGVASFNTLAGLGQAVGHYARFNGAGITFGVNSVNSILLRSIRLTNKPLLRVPAKDCPLLREQWGRWGDGANLRAPPSSASLMPMPFGGCPLGHVPKVRPEAQLPHCVEYPTDCQAAAIVGNVGDRVVRLGHLARIVNCEAGLTQRTQQSAKARRRGQRHGQCNPAQRRHIQ
jgi:hypothetical protein